MNKNNKFLLVMMMVMLTMFSITISAKEHADDKKLSCDGPYVVYQTDGSVRVISVTENGEVKDTVYAVLPRILLCMWLTMRGNTLSLYVCIL